MAKFTFDGRSLTLGELDTLSKDHDDDCDADEGHKGKDHPEGPRRAPVRVPEHCDPVPGEATIQLQGDAQVQAHAAEADEVEELRGDVRSYEVLQCDYLLTKGVR